MEKGTRKYNYERDAWKEENSRGNYFNLTEREKGWGKELTREQKNKTFGKAREERS
jgi:hypothetical protein